ncbi:WD domain, G-beta repeat protein [Oesophagostomum dentatum]|uniref:WD domain, G-beta repeat protein n=1 Tax=Oesophagostomum dentatum TaxID=61180 RepID=A0A0B1RZQ5_OESDE|nr:WD domain, G-beta repeat protein [Oesophagostomum dentatum]
MLLIENHLDSFLGDAEDVTYCVAVQPHRFITTSADGCIRLYNTTTKEREWRKSYGDGINCASTDPSGLLLVIGFTTGSWNVLDLSSQDTVFEQNESTQPITAIQFAPNGVHLFVASKDLSATIYRMDSPQRFQRIARIGALSSFAISPDWDVDSQYVRANSTVGHIYHCEFKNV